MKDDHNRVLESLMYDGIRINKLRLASFSDTGRGLAATELIEQHENLITVPTRYLLNLKVIGKEWSFDWKRYQQPHLNVQLVDLK